MRDHKEYTNRAFWPLISDLCHAAVPALCYTILSNLVYTLSAAAGRDLPGILRQAFSMAVCLAVFGWAAIREQLAVRGLKGTVYRYPASFCYTMAVVMGGVACNLVILLTQLSQKSQGYRHVKEVFYGNGLLIEIIALCVIGPFTEELVYRGFVYQRLRKNLGSGAAIVLSALLFGILHMNLVQGIYAFVLGLLLAGIVYKTESLLTAAAAHMAANLMSVLWTETEWLRFLNREGMERYVVIGLSAVLSVVFFSYGNQLMKRKK